MNVQSDEALSTEGWNVLNSGLFIQSICDPSNNYSVPFIYGTRDGTKPQSGIYKCIANSNLLPYTFEITRQIKTNLPHYLITFDIELILFGNWAIEGINSCNRSDYVVLTADQKQYKFTIQDAVRDSYACKYPSSGYLLKITTSFEHKADTLIISLASNSLSDFTMVSFGIRKFDVSSNLCPDEKCLACNDQKTCLSCKDNYLVSFDGRQCDQTCPTNYYIKAGRCVRECGSDSIFDLPTKTCILCDPNCEICSSTTFCQKCHLSYYSFKGKCYSQCPSDSVYPKDGTNECKECSQGCTECNSQGQCRQCESKYVLLNGICEKCKDPNCSRCINGDLYGCLSCDKGYYFSEKKCISDKCQDDDYRIKNKECQVCMGGFYYDITTHSCIECHSLCHHCQGTSWDQCTQCSTLRWRYGYQNSTKLDLYDSKLGICQCQSSSQFDTLSDTCSEIGHWYVMTDIMLFIIFFASLQLAYRGKMVYLMNFMYFLQSLALLGFLNVSYPYFIQEMLNAFNRVNLPSLFPRVFIVDTNKMQLNDRSQIVYFSNSPSEISDIFSNSKFMLYYDRTSNFMLNIPNFLIINLIPFFAYIFLVVYERKHKKKFRLDRTIRNELIPFFLYHSLVDIYFYIILQFEHTSSSEQINVTGTVGAVIAFVALIVIAYFHTYTLLRSIIAFKKKEKNHNIFKFSVYLRDINFLNGNIFQQNFRTIQTLKQFILVCCIVGAYQNSITQAILLLVFQFVYYMILIIVRPFVSDQLNKEHILYETLLFINIFFGCWYEFSFGIEGENIKQFVGVAFILFIIILLVSLLSSTLYNLYKIEKPILKQYLQKRRLILQEKNRERLKLQQKKNSITELAKNFEYNQDKNNPEISDSGSDQSGSQRRQKKTNAANLANQSTGQRNNLRTPKNVLPSGLKSSKNINSASNQDVSEFFNHNDDTLNVQLAPDYRNIKKDEIQPYNNNSILVSDNPPITGLNGGYSRRNPYAQNNNSMSYYLNETDQNIITETYVKQQENPNILSVLDDEINYNLDNQSVVRLSDRQDQYRPQQSISSQNNFNHLISNNLNNVDKNDNDSIYNPNFQQNQYYQSSKPNIHVEQPIVSQSIKNEFYDKKLYHNQTNKTLIPNDALGNGEISANRFENITPITLHGDNSSQSIMLNQTRIHQNIKGDEQSFGVQDNRSMTINNEEDEYNKTFIISQNAIQQVTNFHQLNPSQDNLKQDPLKNYISKSNAVQIFTDQPQRNKVLSSQSNNNYARTLEQNKSVGEINSVQFRANAQIGTNRLEQNDSSSFADNTYSNFNNEQADNTMNAAKNNYISSDNWNNNTNDENKKDNIGLNKQTEGKLSDSILNYSIEQQVAGQEKQLSLIQNNSAIKSAASKLQKGVFQKAAKQITNNLQKSSQIQQQQQQSSALRPFRESPTKPQKLATKKKKSLQNSKTIQQLTVQEQDVPKNQLEYLDQQSNQFIKKALDTELMYKWKDQQYNYNSDENEDDYNQ